MNIFLRELKAHRKALIIWIVVIFLTIISSIGKFTAYAETGQSMNELLSQIPPSLKAVLGMGTFDLTTISGFYGMLYLYLVLLATVHATLLGANMIAKEERDRTAEFLFVKPISRERIMTAKLFAALFNVIIFNVSTMLFSIVLMGKYAKGESLTHEIVVLMIGMFILQLLFLLIGTAIAAVSKNPKSAASISTTVLLVTFIISSLVNINSKLEPLAYFTPFEYFRADPLLNGEGFNPVFLTLSFVLIVALLFVTYASYKRKDLNV